ERLYLLPTIRRTWRNVGRVDGYTLASDPENALRPRHRKKEVFKRREAKPGCHQQPVTSGPDKMTRRPEKGEAVHHRSKSAFLESMTEGDSARSRYLLQGYD